MTGCPSVVHQYAHISFDIERITPEIAEAYLKRNTDNRKISPGTVTKLAHALRRGEWQLNGDTIRFSDDGALLDGQHRLRAIVVSEIPADCCIIRGLDRSVFKTIDNGKLRNAGDCLYVLKYKNPNALASAGRMLFVYESRKWGATRIGAACRVSNAELISLIERHPGLVSQGNEYMRKPLFTRLIPHSVGMLCYYLASKLSQYKAQTFFTDLADTECQPLDGKYPPHQLRATLQKRAQEFIKPTTEEKLAWTIECWNAFYAGKGIERLSRIVETVPRFHPAPLK